MDQPLAKRGALPGQAMGKLGIHAAHQRVVVGFVVLLDEADAIDDSLRLRLAKRLAKRRVIGDVIDLNRLARVKKLVLCKIGDRPAQCHPNLVPLVEAAPKLVPQHTAAPKDEQPQGWASFPCRAGMPRTSLMATRLKACFGLRLIRSSSVSSSSHSRQPGKLYFGPAM